MSVTIVSTPDPIQPLEAFSFEVNLSAAGTDPVQNSLGYQFKGPGGVVLLETSRIDYTGQNEVLDFTELVAKEVSTDAPSLTSRSLTTETNFAKAFTLEAGLITYNKDTQESTVTLDQVSSAITGLNARVRSWELASRFNAGGGIVLSDRPNISYVREGQSDWLYVYRSSGAIYYEVDANFVGGTTAKDFGSTTPGGLAKRIPVGPANLFSGPYGAQLLSYVITIREGTSGGAVVGTYRFVVEPACDPQPIGEFISREPLGGFSSLKVDAVSAGVSTSSIGYMEGVAPGGNKSATSGGFSRANVKGTQVFTLQGVMEYSEGLDLWLSGLFASDQTYVRYYDRSGSRLVKCTVIDGQFPTYGGKQTTYSVTVRLHHNVSA